MEKAHETHLESVRVGQWARDEQGNILELCKTTAYIFTSHTKVANTPVELIQVGDLVTPIMYPHNSFIVNKIIKRESGISLKMGERLDICIENITKILTPNSNGGYDLQWEVTLSNDKTL